MAITEESLHLDTLPAEPWGRALRRARDAAGLTLVAVEEITGREITVSALNLLENRGSRPTARSQRRRAAMAMVLYGYAPSEVGLELEDVGMVDVRRLRTLLAEYAPRDSNPEPSDSLLEDAA